MMTNMEMLKDLVEAMRNNAIDSDESEEYKQGAVSAFNHVLKQIVNG